MHNQLKSLGIIKLYSDWHGGCSLVAAEKKQQKSFSPLR